MWNVEKLNAGNYFIVAFLLVFLSGLGASAQEGSPEIGLLEAKGVVEDVAIPYITALQTGDVKTLERLIDGQLAVTLGTLLRENEEYPKFLRDKYGKAQVLDTISILEQKVIEGFVKTPNDLGSGVLTVEMSKSNGEPMNLQLNFEKGPAGHWRVVTQKVIR